MSWEETFNLWVKCYTKDMNKTSSKQNIEEKEDSQMTKVNEKITVSNNEHKRTYTNKTARKRFVVRKRNMSGAKRCK